MKDRSRKSAGTPNSFPPWCRQSLLQAWPKLMAFCNRVRQRNSKSIMGNSGSGQRNQRTKVCSTGHLTLILSVVDPISQPSTHEPTQRSHQGNNDSEREKEVAREREREGWFLLCFLRCWEIPCSRIGGHICGYLQRDEQQTCGSVQRMPKLHHPSGLGQERCKLEF